MSDPAQTKRVRPLGGSSQWPTAAMVDVTVAASGLTLRALPDGPLGLNDPRDTLGGLVGPRWLAVGPGESTYAINPRGVVHRLDCLSEAFLALPAELGRASARRTELAVARDRLAVVEADQLHVYSLGSLARVAVLDAATTGGVPVRSVAAGRGGVLALDADGRLWRPTPSGWSAASIEGAATRWRRVAMDRTGGIHVLADTDSGAVLIEVAPDGRRLAEVRDPLAVAGRFDPAPRRDPFGRYSVASLAQPIDRNLAAPSQPVRGDPPAAVATHERSGRWTSDPLDSRIHGCRWHRIEIALGALPAGTTVQVLTASGEQPGPPPAVGFAPIATVRGPVLDDEEPPAVAGDALLAQEGRVLWVRLELSGDGLATPRVEGLRLHYPRVSALHDLPAVFSADAESRELLERMLAAFQTTWDELETTIDELPRYLDPATVPEGREAALAELAAWLAVRREGDWSPDQLRRVLGAEGRLAPRRGTVAALREAIATAVAGLPEARVRPVPELPAVVEGFTHRDRLVLGSVHSSGLGRSQPLAAASEEGRLRLGMDKLGAARAMAGPDSPEAELLARHAHRFSVSLPAAWVRSEAAEQMLRRAIDSERPAHVAYDLCLVEPRLRVGVQSAIGVDSVIGGPVRTVLTSHHTADAPDPARRPPPSRAVHGRLGLDAVLVSIDELPGGPPGVASPKPRRAGIDAVLA